PILTAQNIDTAAIERLSRAALNDFELPGLAIAVVKDDKVVYAKGFGVREFGGTAPVTADTLFHIASTSKAFTTTAMAMLVDEKKMSWDDPVRKHIPFFRLSDPCADSLVTLRDIVSHRTGLNRRDELWDYGTWSREEVVRRIGLIELNKPFRSAYQYQNIMFMAAGEAVDSAAGIPWEQFVDTRIFEPLGMNNSVISEAEWLRATDRSASHFYDSTKKTIRPYKANAYESLGPAGSIKSTARDLAQWVRFQLNGGEIDGKRLLSEAALKETWKPHTIVPGSPSAEDETPETNISAYGLGWRVQDYRGQLLVWHSGSLNFNRAQVALLPRLRAGVVVLTNVNRGYGIAALRNSVLDLLINDGSRDWNAFFLALEKKEDAEAEKSKREAEEKRHRDTKPSREISAYAGTYSNDAYGDITVTESNGALTMSWQRVTVPLTHYHFDSFSAVSEEQEFDERVTFDLDRSGDVKVLEIFGEEFRKK
ncbi:MAG TPA: serine hydrolase, partial [Thermoanaerobaculia bacterium]